MFARQPGGYGSSLEVECPGVRDIQGLGLAGTTWRGVEGIHTPAAGVYHIRHEASAVTAHILHDTAVGVHVRELFLHAPPLQPLQGSEAGQGRQGALPKPLCPPHPRQAEQSPPHKSPSSGRTGTLGSDYLVPPAPPPSQRRNPHTALSPPGASPRAARTGTRLFSVLAWFWQLTPSEDSQSPVCRRGCEQTS